MITKCISATALSVCLSLLGCGGSTPAPESPDRRGGDAAGSETDSDGGSEGSQGGGTSSDPETTEEVIETSGPLD